MNDDSSFSDAGYLRPQARFRCGDESACRRGPGPSGDCCAEPECLPELIDGRWQCRRTVARGGVCESGPTPDGGCGCAPRRCRPIRSLRSQRGRIAFLTTAITVALATILLSSPRNGALLAPGPLCAKHARVLGDLQGMDRCSRCHAAAESPSWWTLGLPFSSVGATQSEKCLACHSSTLGRTASRSPHNVAPTRLAEITRDRRERTEDRGLTLVGHFDRLGAFEPMAELECATCHREHRGEAGLAELTDRQCQTCHVGSFHAFEVDHPEFRSFPTRFEPHVAFDHAKHEHDYFARKGIAYACDRCHEPDATRRIQVLRSFEDACSECHVEPIAAASLEGIELLRLPTLDLERLRQAGFEPGDWPADATGDFDGELSPLLVALLSGDGATRRAIDQLGGSVDLVLIDPDDPSDLEAVGAIVLGLKRLMWELASGDRERIAARLERAGAVDAIACRELASALPWSQLEEAVALWLPELEFETMRVGRSDRTASPVVTSQPLGTPLSVVPIGFFGGEGERQSLAVNPLLDLRRTRESPNAAQAEGRAPRSGPDTSRTEKPDETPNVTAPNSSRLSEVPAASVPANDSGVAPGTEPTISRPRRNGNGERLADNPLARLHGDSGAANEPARTIDAPESTLVEGTPESIDPRSANEPTETRIAESPDVSPGDVPQIVDANEGAEASGGMPIESQGEVLPWRYEPRRRSGWVRDDVTRTLRYHPIGHADPFVAKLFEVVVGTSIDGRTEESSDAAVATTPHPQLPLDALHAAFVEVRSADEQASERASESPLDPATDRRASDDQASRASSAMRSGEAGIGLLRERLLGAAPFGACAQCHQAPGGDSGRPMAWRGWRRDVSRGEFVRFSHGPHLIQPETADCRHCHRSTTENSAALRSVAVGTTAVRFDELAHTSDFVHATRNDCASCHRAGRAPNRCTTCHDYHVGTLRLHP